MIRGAGKANSIPLMGKAHEPSIFEYSTAGRSSHSLRNTSIPAWQADELLDARFLRTEPVDIAEVSERDMVAHFTRLTHRQYSVDLGAYPLGSCTMKYNPKVCDDLAGLTGFTQMHPDTPVRGCQGWLQLLVELEAVLVAITGMSQATLQPPAGAAGELTGLLIMKAFHGKDSSRDVVIIPDSAHGTNPASVTLAGYKTVSVPTDKDGGVDIEILKQLVNANVVGMMLTNPNTLGLFERQIGEVAKIIHDAGGLMYYDGANLNAIVGQCRPGDMGFDIVHMNLHKTFAVPHGGGGPGAGPVAVTQQLSKYLPGPKPELFANGEYGWVIPENSIGRVHGWHGNALALLRAYVYIRLHGLEGIKGISKYAVLNANWLKWRLSEVMPAAFDQICMHEFVVSLTEFKRKTNAKALDVAKGLMDQGFHAPTTYFPLIVEEALMIEPTETESLQTLEEMARGFETVLSEIASAAALPTYPLNTPVGRVDEANAARNLVSTVDARKVGE